MIALVLAAGLLPRAQPALDAVAAARISAHVRFLSDDLLEGRGTGSRGEAIAQRYVAAQLEALGARVQLQPVELLEVRAEGHVSAAGAPIEGAIVAGDGRGERKALEGALVFVRHALPEDLRTIDVRGKIAAVLSGAPASLPSTARALASSNEDKLARLQAAGAIAEIVLTTPEVDQRRPWSLLRQNFAKGQLFDTSAPPPMPVAYADLAQSDRLLHDRPSSARIELVQKQQPVRSANVIGILPGDSDEAIAYSAHLDHHGICAPGASDPICNGAIDNATGVAEMLEIARGFAALPRRARTVVFIALTGEERGLLGSSFFAHHPTLPPRKIVADLNLDQLLPAWRLKELVLRGAELSTLESHVRAAADALGLVIGPDPVPEQNFFARSDQLWFARIGVPSACLWQGFLDPSGSRQKGEAAFKDFRAHRYHQPSDEWSADYDWEAAAQMARAELLVGISLLEGPAPQWKPDAPFRRE